MNRENQLPAEWTPDEDPLLSAGRFIARQWAELPPEHLTAAMKAMEPELRRGNRERMARMKLQDIADARAHEERQQQRQHRQHAAELTVGAVVALAMLAGGVYVAPESWWLSTLLCGPSLLALAKVFILRRSDPDDMKAVAGAARTSTNAAGQAGSQQPPVV
ncbi:hypothetical protein [Streptomyces sp. NBC_00199]|uniref:hypothetical protein n=1 Tax=Streptomyces sp. NBC_00199 TaxID=2975678 RepID=UPI00224E61AD|nr:hypothetical protein [Streptomyces sp. NBC_00199]MCX5269966.1 hypothetical protein [Streptomyces sp. NBC_00199]